MNTTSHVILNLAVQRKLIKEPALKKRIAAAGIAGSLLPDAPMFLFFLAALLKGAPQREIWEVLYFQPGWQLFFNIFNAVPLYTLGFSLCLIAKKYGWGSFFLGGLLHGFGDLFLHHDDGHAHFLPFTDWVFSSPVSYWDPRHYGLIAAPLEVLAVLAVSLYLWRQGGGVGGKVALGLANLFNLAVLGGTYFMAENFGALPG